MNGYLSVIAGDITIPSRFCMDPDTGLQREDSADVEVTVVVAGSSFPLVGNVTMIRDHINGGWVPLGVEDSHWISPGLLSELFGEWKLEEIFACDDNPPFSDWLKELSADVAEHLKQNEVSNGGA